MFEVGKRKRRCISSLGFQVAGPLVDRKSRRYLGLARAGLFLQFLLHITAFAAQCFNCVVEFDGHRPRRFLV